MNNFIFENSTKVYFGKGCVKEYLACLAGKYDGNIMLCYGGGSIKKNGIYDEVIKMLASTGKDVYEFFDIMPNPTYSKVLEGAEFAREKGIGLILGVGGASVIDCCKAISIAARYDGNVWGNFWARPGIIDFEPLLIGVIVTETGTGSECNGVAIITNEERKVKTGRDYPQCNPRFALMDSSYTYSVPRTQMISGGFAALSHIMEDYTARSNLMWDAAMAENRILKLGKKTDSTCYQIEYQLAAYTGCNFGAGLAVLQPVYYRHIYKERLAKFKRFAIQVWGVPAEGRSDEEIGRAGVEVLSDFIREIGLPVTMQELGVDKSMDLQEVADSCTVLPGSGRKMVQSEIYNILQGTV